MGSRGSSTSRALALLLRQSQEYIFQSRVARRIRHMPQTLNVANRDNLSVINNRDPTSVRLSDVQVVGRKYRRNALLRLPANPVFDRDASLRVQRRQWLIQHQN